MRAKDCLLRAVRNLANSVWDCEQAAASAWLSALEGPEATGGAEGGVTELDSCARDELGNIAKEKRLKVRISRVILAVIATEKCDSE